MLDGGTSRKLGVLVVGVGGAVSTTAIVGTEGIKAGANDFGGLPLASVGVSGLASYRDLQFAGWDLSRDDLATAVAEHQVVNAERAAAVEPVLKEMRPWPAVGSRGWCQNIDGDNRATAGGHREAVEAITRDIRAYRERSGVDGL